MIRYDRRGQARLQPCVREHVGLFYRHPCKAAALNAKSKQEIQIPSNETEEEIKGTRGGRWHFSAVLCSKTRHKKCYYHYFTHVFPQGICTVCRYIPAQKLYIETRTAWTTSVHQTQAQLRTLNHGIWNSHTILFLKGSSERLTHSINCSHTYTALAPEG